MHILGEEEEAKQLKEEEESQELSAESDSEEESDPTEVSFHFV